MNGPDFKDLRVLVVGGTAHAMQVLRTVLNIVGIADIEYAPTSIMALQQLRTRYFDAVFCDQSTARIDGADFPLAARRTQGLMNPMIPLFLTSSGPRRRDVELARDEGVTDVLARPISAATMRRKLLLAIARPRPFIASNEFFGPDRRAKGRPNWKGGERRTRQARKVKVASKANDGDITLI
jgi:two-component system chemotaxis response regulator CheY